MRGTAHNVKHVEALSRTKPCHARQSSGGPIGEAIDPVTFVNGGFDDDHDLEWHAVALRTDRRDGREEVVPARLGVCADDDGHERVGACARI